MCPPGTGSTAWGTESPRKDLAVEGSNVAAFKRADNLVELLPADLLWFAAFWALKAPGDWGAALLLVLLLCPQFWSFTERSNIDELQHVQTIALTCMWLISMPCVTFLNTLVFTV